MRRDADCGLSGRGGFAAGDKGRSGGRWAARSFGGGEELGALLCHVTTRWDAPRAHFEKHC